MRKNNGIRVRLFRQSLSRKDLEWYAKQDGIKWHIWDDLGNASVDHYKFYVEILPDKIFTIKLRLKSNKCFHEYVIQWRDEATNVQPHMEEAEMIIYFIQALNPVYFDRMVTMAEKHLFKLSR